MSRVKMIISAVKLVLAYLISWLSPSEDIWLVSERPGQARDNGYCFYTYLKKNKPEQKVFYIIDKSSDDYQKIKEYGNVIQFNSWQHYLYYCISKVHISAHVNGCCPDYCISASRRLKNQIGFKDVFIPHGVSYGVSEFCLQKYTKINLFICSGKPEYDNVLANYGYTENEVAYTGFPRLDGWHHILVNPKQIVMMPTWRLYLAQNPDIEFVDTQFFNAYRDVIQSERLSTFLKENDIHLIFYLHNEMRKYVKSFVSDCNNVEVVYDDSKYDIQELLKSSALLITDYSSVHFDFAYMNKPVIYYQFDKQEFFSKQYQQSFFDAEKNGFGPVVYSSTDLVKEICRMSKMNFSMTEEYYSRMRKFYQIYDDNNCQRVYKTIKERIGR